jgi:Zn-dependent membrane protease YugP
MQPHLFTHMPAILANFYLSTNLLYVLGFFSVIFAVWAQFRVSSVYQRNAAIPSRGGITGREAAKAVMDHAGITDVEITETEGHLTDHYDPMNKRLVLSAENYNGTSLAALGVAAHEAGHAIQHKTGYAMLHARMALIPATQIAAPIAMVVATIGVFWISMVARGAIGMIAIEIGVVALAVMTLFQLITLPVEYDASRRAKVQLVQLGILGQDEMVGVNETLDAAGLTYVAALAVTMIQLLQLLSILGGSRRN